MARKDSTNSNTDSTRSVPEISSVSVRTFHGPLSAGNQFSLDWSFNGLIAFGCQNQVLVAETREPLRVVQSLDKHKYQVNRVKWPQDNGLRLASSDAKGNIIIWDVIEGTFLSIISGDSKELKNVLSIEWVKGDTGGKNPTGAYLMVLYSSNILVLYDTELGDVVWKKSLAAASNHLDYNLKDMCVDPFSKSNAIFSLTPTSPQNVHCCFLRAEDSMSSTIKTKRYQLYVRNSDGPSASSPVKSPRLQLAVKYVGSGLVNREGEELSNYLLEYKQIAYSKSRRNEVVLVLNKEIVVVNIITVTMMAIIGLERNSSSIMDLYAARQRNAFLTLHESGNVIVRLLQKQTRFEDHIGTNVLELSYASVCHSEGIRLTKQNRIVGFSVSPADETRVALLLNNGRLLIKRIMRKGLRQSSDGTEPTLSDLIPIDAYVWKASDSIKDHLRLVQSQLLGALSSPTVIRSCPPITKYNWRYHRPLLAIGDSSGSILVYDLACGLQEKELAIHSSPVRGLEWVSLGAFLSFSFPNLPRTNTSGKVTNELFLTDIASGRSEAVRSERNANSSPIDAMKVSHLKQYFILTFKNEPFEIWDLKSLCILRVMPKQFASVTAVEWSPLYNKRQPVGQTRVEEKKETPETTTGDDTGSATKDSGTPKEKERSASPPDITKTVAVIKENFVVTSGQGELYHFSVEGNVTKEISCIPRDASHGQITCIAWKGDQVVLGDADGNLHYWDLKKKQSSTKSSHRGWVKKVRFGPGRGNMKCLVLYSDGVEVWDVQDMSVHSELKAPRDVTFKVIDVDWAGSDRPVLSTSDGFIFVTDLKLRRYSSQLDLISKHEKLPDPLVLSRVNLHLIDPKLRSNLITNYLHGDGQESPRVLLDKCIKVATLMGDKVAVAFWQLVGHHVLPPGDFEAIDEHLELFFDNEAFRELQRERVAALELKRTKHEQNEVCCEYHVLLGNHQRAVQLLLETDAIQSKDKYYKDALKACLIAALQASSGGARPPSAAGGDAASDLIGFDASAQPVVKLVATSLIASGAVEEGVQLLYLIGKVQDACRYLQSNGLWEKSVWVAKTYLSNEESLEILRRWLDHLILQNEREVELYALLSMKNFEKVLETLTNRQELQIAALFADICQASGAFPPEAKVTVDFVYLKYSQWLQESQLEETAQIYKAKVSEE